MLSKVFRKSIDFTVAMSKIGRNDPCPCGSGKKYKKCHLLMEGFPKGIPIVKKIEPTPEITDQMEAVFEKNKERRAKMHQLGIYIDFVTPIHYKDNKVWALGNRLYPYEKEDQTFHEFIIKVLRLELGKEWWESQTNLTVNEQHFVFRSYIKLYDWMERNETPENRHKGRWRAVPDGYSRALISLAFDVCSLLHAVHVPEIFMNKLRSYDDYQSVRYEIAVSAMFARMGFKIRFLDEEVVGQSSQPKHAEFIAIDPMTNEEIVVEVKSKEREGVLHISGEFDKTKEFKSSVTKLYRRALEQREDGKPFIVFIDMNLPFTPDTNPGDIPWVKAVTKMRDEAVFSTKGKKSPTNYIVFTNYSYHYGSENETGSGEWLLETCGNTEVPMNIPDFNEKFFSTLQGYGKVPNLDMEFET